MNSGCRFKVGLAPARCAFTFRAANKKEEEVEEEHALYGWDALFSRTTGETVCARENPTDISANGRQMARVET